MKFNIGDKLHISGEITVTGANKCGDGIYSYNTEVGTFHEPALEKLVCKTASVKPEDKPKFKVWDKAKIIGNSGNPRHFFEVGQIVNIGEVHQRYKGEWCARCTRRYGEQNINFYDLEPYAEPAEPAKEPVKLYCVKSYRDELIKGKVYEFDGHRVNYEHTECFYATDFEQWKRGDRGYSACLVPLVSRPAKAGEYIMVTNMDDGAYHDGRFDMGDILRVTKDDTNIIDQWKGKAVCFKNVTHPDYPYQHCVVVNKDYLVLDGYDGRYEPKYYSGKVVCVKKANDFLTAGKVYTFKNGKSSGDNGLAFPGISHVTSLEMLNEIMWSDFIEYKGEAT